MKVFVLLFFTSIIYSQSVETTLIHSEDLYADTFIGVDELNNIYYIKDQVLFKKNNLETLNYSNVNLGEIHSVSINNPFKIIVFYKDFNSIVVLDNKLNALTETITFSNLNISLVGYASENNLWIYSKDNNILQLYDYQNRESNINSQPLSFYKENFFASDLSSSNENIWLYDDNSLLQFNQYASFIDAFPIQNITQLFPFRKGFIYLKEEQLYLVDQDLTKKITLKSPCIENSIFFKKGNFYFFCNDKIYQYKLID